MLIFQLLKQVAPNYTKAPTWNQQEIFGLFGALAYPFTIRADAITAVGAPSSIQYLMRAIYWLFQVTKVYFMQKQTIRESLSMGGGE